jgi:soluble lytic murein transglycosylase-like protein
MEPFLHLHGRAKSVAPRKQTIRFRLIATCPIALLLAEAAPACTDALPPRFHEGHGTCLALMAAVDGDGRSARVQAAIERPRTAAAIPLPPPASGRPLAISQRAASQVVTLRTRSALWHSMSRPVPRYQAEILEAGLRHRIDPALLASLIEAESRFRADAISPRGALGLTQVMPATARDLGIDPPERLLTDPELAIDAGARYLRHLHQRFGNDLPRVLAGYNAGPGAVVRHGGIPPYPETRAYVGRVLASYAERRRLATGRGA